MVMTEGKSTATPLNSLNPNKAQLDLQNEVHYVSELPLVPKWAAVKFGRTKKTSVLEFPGLRPWTFFRSSNFDGWPFWNQWEFRDIKYPILKV